MSKKISVRFYKDFTVRAVWDEEQNQWWFSVLDIVGAIVFAFIYSEIYFQVIKKHKNKSKSKK